MRTSHIVNSVLMPLSISFLLVRRSNLHKRIYIDYPSPTYLPLLTRATSSLFALRIQPLLSCVGAHCEYPIGFFLLLFPYPLLAEQPRPRSRRLRARGYAINLNSGRIFELSTLSRFEAVGARRREGAPPHADRTGGLFCARARCAHGERSELFAICRAKETTNCLFWQREWRCEPARFSNKIPTEYVFGNAS